MASNGFMTRTTLWTHEHLTTLGLTDAQLKQHLRDGTMVRLRRGVYAPTQQADVFAEHRRRIQAAAIDVHDSSVFSHTSAAVLHGLPVRIESLREVTMTRRTPGHGDHSDLLRVRRTAIRDDEVTRIAGLPVTTLPRTVTDLARTSPFEWGLAAVDAALGRGLKRDFLHDELHRHPRLHGVKRARRVLALGDGRAESPAESLSRFHMMRAGIPAPELQFEIFDANGEFVARADFGWPEHGLVGEVDGRIKYRELLGPGQSAADVVMAEKRREQRIRACGYWVVRWGWREANDQASLTALLNAGFASASPAWPARRGA